MALCPRIPANFASRDERCRKKSFVSFSVSFNGVRWRYLLRRNNLTKSQVQKLCESILRRGRIKRIDERVCLLRLLYSRKLGRRAIAVRFTTGRDRGGGAARMDFG